jgi:ketosteroid isomerase-like protein
MTIDQEVYAVLIKHLEAVQHNDLDAYHATTSEDLTLYEWWITPHRIDGLPFHDFMMAENARRGTVFGSEGQGSDAAAQTRFDLSNLHIQRYGDTAIASYTLLASTGTASGVTVAAHNESRVLVKQDGQWKVVHVHKSPAYPAPHTG